MLSISIGIFIYLLHLSKMQVQFDIPIIGLMLCDFMLFCLIITFKYEKVSK